MRQDPRQQAPPQTGPAGGKSHLPRRATPRSFTAPAVPVPAQPNQPSAPDHTDPRTR